MAGGAAMWRLAVRREGHFPPRVRLSFAEAGQLQSRCMAKVILKDLKKVYPNTEKKKKAKKGEESAEKKSSLQITEEGVVAVQQFSLEIADKEFIVLVGPSGCGKSTTLRMIAGLEDITSGELWIGDKLMNDVEPKDRDIAMVFQNYALYPHMTVRENIAFPLKLRKMDKAEIDQRVEQAAEILDITEYLDRKPKALSRRQLQNGVLVFVVVIDNVLYGAGKLQQVQVVPHALPVLPQQGVGVRQVFHDAGVRSPGKKFHALAFQPAAQGRVRAAHRNVKDHRIPPLQTRPCILRGAGV